MAMDRIPPSASDEMEMVNTFNQSSVDRFMDSLIEIKPPTKLPPATPAQVLDCNGPNAVDGIFDAIVSPVAENQTGTLPAQTQVYSDQSAVDSTSSPDRVVIVNQTSATSNQTPGVKIYAPPLPVAQPAEIEYLELVVRALLTHGRPMLVADIYEWIVNNFPSKTISRSWRNSVRHVLTTMCYFYQESHSSYGKAHYWWIHADYLEGFRLGHFKKRDIEAFVEKSARSKQHASSLRHHPYMQSTPMEKQHKQRRHSLRRTTDREPTSMPNTSWGQVQNGLRQSSTLNSADSDYTSASGSWSTVHTRAASFHNPHTPDGACYWQSPSDNSSLNLANSNPWGYNIGHDHQYFSTSPSTGPSPNPYQMQHHELQNPHSLQEALHNLQHISHGQTNIREP